MQSGDNDAVTAFKQQLGIHPSEDASFGWIAEVGLQSPLPPRWTSHTDTESGYVYYVDHDRQVSSWENPLVPFLRRVVEIGRSYQKQPAPGFFEEQKGLLWHQHKHELDCWHGPFADEGGRQYYVNGAEGVSSWQDPRVDAQYIFELEGGLLTSLEEVLRLPDPPDTPGFGPESGASLMYRTPDGAEVLTLDGLGAASGIRPVTGRPDLKAQLLTQAKWNAKEEHKSMLEKMSVSAVRLRDMQQDDLEVQRLQFNKKVEARRQRKKMSEASEWGAHMKAGTVRIPQDPGVAACVHALRSPLAVEGGHPQPPAAAGFLPPPPPPPQADGALAEPRPPAMSPRAEERLSLGLAL